MGTQKLGSVRVPIDEMVGLLALGPGSELDRIRVEFREFAPLLEDDGIMLGDSGLEVSDREERRVQMLLAVGAASTEKAIQLCRASLPRLRARLESANRLRVAAEWVTLASSAAIFVALGKDFPPFGTYGLATLAFLGSLLTKTVQYRITGLRPDGANLFTVQATLAECLFVAERIADEFAIMYPAVAADHDRVVDLVTRANVLAQKVHSAVNSI